MDYQGKNKGESSVEYNKSRAKENKSGSGSTGGSSKTDKVVNSTKDKVHKILNK